MYLHRWNCWYDAAAYHKEHLPKYAAFIEEEMDHAGSLAPRSLCELSELFKDEQKLRVLQVHLDFIVAKSKIFIDALNTFQSNSLLTMSVSVKPSFIDI